MVLNVVALWKQEARDPARTSRRGERPQLPRLLARISAMPAARRACWSRVGLGTAAFSMQDILLEPYGGEILHLTVGATTALTALLAAGALMRLCDRGAPARPGADPYRVAASARSLGWSRSRP